MSRYQVTPHSRYILRMRYGIIGGVGVCDSIQAITKAIHLPLSSYPPLAGVSMHYSRVINPIYFLRVASESTMTFEGHLAAILGFKHREPFPLPSNTKSLFAPFPADIHAACYTLYVFSLMTAAAAH